MSPPCEQRLPRKLLRGAYRPSSARQAILLLVVLLGHLALMVSPLHAEPTHAEGVFVAHGDREVEAHDCPECNCPQVLAGEPPRVL